MRKRADVQLLLNYPSSLNRRSNVSKQNQIKGNKKADCIRQDNQSASRTSHHNHTGDETMNSQIVPQTVTFNNQELITFEQNGIQYTAMKPICENIGIDWRSQRQRILRDDVLSQAVVMITTPSKGGLQEMLSLPIKMLNGWLFGVDSKRVKTDKAKEYLLKYKLECFEALYNYWHKGEAVNPRFEKITDKQAYQLKTAVEKRCKNNKEHYQTVWTALKHRFEVPKYTDILVKDFDNAMNLVWTVALPQPTLIIENESLANIKNLSRLGKTKVEANKLNFEIIEKALTMIDYAVGELRKNNSTHHSVFENIFCQAV